MKFRHQLFYLQRASDDVHDYYGEDYSSFTATWTYLITHHRMTTYYYEGEPEDAPVNTNLMISRVVMIPYNVRNVTNVFFVNEHYTINIFL